jgi:two-component system nitrogen regulation sensor histidine kinase NtrY
LLFTATIALGLFLARGIFEPLRGLVVGTRRISQGDFTVRLPSERGDEIGTVERAFNEMTERVADSQRALEERRRYLEIILQSVGTGVISTDETDAIRTVNAAAARILGVDGDAWVGQSVAALGAETGAGEIGALLAGARAQGEAFAAGEMALLREGRAATVKYMLTRLEHEGSYLGAVFVFEDLTELIQSKKLAAWVEMARQIAHEIKNPLTPIRISTQFMQRAYEQKPEQFDRIFREGTATIIQQVDVLKRIAGEFSSYGRMQQLAVAPHGLDAILAGIVAPYTQSAANVRIRIGNENRAGNVYVDPEAVRKICANLIENALDAMSASGGELRIDCDETLRGQERLVRVRFRDSGPGLSNEAAARLFEPYFSTKTTGTGLGLAISRTLAREMGGDLVVANAGGGAGVEAVLLLRRAA